jgi:hypothetical protein
MPSHALSLAAVLALAAGAAARAEEDFTPDQASDAVRAYVDARVKKDGVFRYKDPRADAVLDLEPDGVRVARQIHPYGFFVCLDLHAKGAPAKAYDLDFWLKPAGDRLEVVDVRIHKAPRRDGEKWVLVTRTPLLWWWIPATEHPGDFEEKRGWQVESAVHEHIARALKDGVLRIPDDKTGRQLALEFVEIHKPLRKLEGKGYFACSDFRERGSGEKFYDLDFWLSEKDGRLEVTEVRIHKEPVEENGRWVQVSRYEFESGKVKEVP